MAKKKRAPIEQLRAAGRIARDMLIKRGLRSEESLIDTILMDSRAPVLPGIPAYLPHQWTLKAAQQVLRDIVIMWKDECGEDIAKQEDITKFWLYVQAKLREQEHAFREEDKAMDKLTKDMKDVPVLKDVFSPKRKLENTQAIHRFLVDSFANAIVVKQHHATGAYLNWFLDWTQDLELLWVRPDKRKKVKRV